MSQFRGGASPRPRHNSQCNLGPVAPEADDLFATPRHTATALQPERSPSVERDEFINAYAEASQAIPPLKGSGPSDVARLSAADVVAEQSEGGNGDRSRVAPQEGATPFEPTVCAAEPCPEPRMKDGACTATRARLMTVGGVAAYLQVSVSAVWRHAKKDPGFPTWIKIGGNTRWDRLELDRYVDRLVAAGKADR